MQQGQNIKLACAGSRFPAEKGGCRGVLLGEENKGMQVMFHMMNKALLDVCAKGFAHGPPSISTPYITIDNSIWARILL